MDSTEKIIATVSAKGWVVIPAPLRHRFGIKPGSRVKIEEANNKIILVPEGTSPVQECFGKFSDKPSLTKALLKEREEEKEREEKK